MFAIGGTAKGVHGWECDQHQFRRKQNIAPSADQNKFIKIMDNVSKATGYVYHSFIIKTDKTLWVSWGNPYYGLDTDDRNDLSFSLK